jgi:hypothetical protein
MLPNGQLRGPDNLPRIPTNAETAILSQHAGRQHASLISPTNAGASSHSSLKPISTSGSSCSSGTGGIGGIGGSGSGLEISKEKVRKKMMSVS